MTNKKSNRVSGTANEAHASEASRNAVKPHSSEVKPESKTEKKTEKKTESSPRKKLFGTDGIRGTANQFPITPDVILRVGQAMGLILMRAPARNKVPKVVIGKDTRLSGYMVENALTSGLNSMGVHVELVGPLPTPGIGFLTRNMRADAGVVISASHNAYVDNGIKIFGPDGYKIPDAMEREIEELVATADFTVSLAESPLIGRSKRIDDADGRYIVHAKNAFPLEYTLEGLRIVLDCAHGAAYKVAPMIFRELGAECIVLGNQPNGFNVNDKSGALYPDRVAEAVLQYRADVGIALDGDADRVVMVDDSGQVVNGDHILAVCALHLKEQNQLPKDTVVATQMSNFALDRLMQSHGIRVIRVDVGDKYVVEEMRKHGYSLGGEQSGHIIFHEHTTTGDGVIAALNVLAVMKSKSANLRSLNAILEDYPQVLVNTRVRRRENLSQIKGYRELIEKIEAQLRGEGRVFVRFSGTEPVVRVLLEGRDRGEISRYAEEIAGFLERELS